MYVVDSRVEISLPLHLFPVYRFFLAAAMITDFGVRLYVSIVSGGSLTNTTIQKKDTSVFFGGL